MNPRSVRSRPESLIGPMYRGHRGTAWGLRDLDSVARRRVMCDLATRSAPVVRSASVLIRLQVASDLGTTASERRIGRLAWIGIGGFEASRRPRGRNVEPEGRAACRSRGPGAVAGPKGRTGGEGGIRTLEGLAPLTVFETARFSRSRTSPSACLHEVTASVQVAAESAGYSGGCRFGATSPLPL